MKNWIISLTHPRVDQTQEFFKDSSTLQDRAHFSRKVMFASCSTHYSATFCLYQTTTTTRPVRLHCHVFDGWTLVRRARGCRLIVVWCHIWRRLSEQCWCCRLSPCAPLYQTSDTYVLRPAPTHSVIVIIIIIIIVTNMQNDMFWVPDNSLLCGACQHICLVRSGWSASCNNPWVWQTDGEMSTASIRSNRVGCTLKMTIHPFTCFPMHGSKKNLPPSSSDLNLINSFVSSGQVEAHSVTLIGPISHTQ